MKPICNNYSGIYVKFLVALFIGGFYSVASIAQPQKKTFDQHIRILEEIEVDSVTSDFPVEFSMVNSRKWQFIAYYNKNRELTVASRKLAEKKWKISLVSNWDYRWDFSGSGTMEREIKINEAKFCLMAASISNIGLLKKGMESF